MASIKAETGEIDTRAPFESVKAGVSLFGEGAFSRKKKTPIRRNSSKHRSIQKLQVVEEDRVLQFPEKVINSNVINVKLQISNAEIAKNRALEELAKAKRTVEELNHMIQSATAMTRESANRPRTEVGNVCEEMFSSFDQLHSERDNALREAEEMKWKFEEFRIEVESSRRNLEETEKKLRISQKETEEAKASEAMTVNQLRIISEQCKSEPGIIISMEEYEALKRLKKEADKEIEDMKIVTQEAMRRAERAEEEVQRWRQREQKKIAELASRILEGTNKPYSLVRKNVRGILGKKNQVVARPL